MNKYISKRGEMVFSLVPRRGVAHVEIHIYLVSKQVRYAERISRNIGTHKSAYLILVVTGQCRSINELR